MNDLELKRKRIETIVKVLGLGVVGFLVAPIIFATIQGLIGLVIAAGISFTVINFIPYFAMKVANWRLKALKAEASKNPVETLQNEYAKKQAALGQFKENIRIFAGQVLSFADQVKQYVKDGLEDADVYTQQLGKMKQILQLRQQKYNEAQEMLTEFAETIERTDRKWKMACAAAAMNEAAGEIEGDVFDKICIETALDSVQSKLNQSFADLEIALMDDEKTKKVAKQNDPIMVQSEVSSETRAPARQRIPER
jgi:methyl-accepting chemotaxis protein